MCSEGTQVMVVKWLSAIIQHKTKFLQRAARSTSAFMVGSSLHCVCIVIK